VYMFMCMCVCLCVCLSVYLCVCVCLFLYICHTSMQIYIYMIRYICIIPMIGLISANHSRAFTATRWTRCNTLQHATTHCNTLQHTATQMCRTEPLSDGESAHCNTLQHTATHCNTDMQDRAIIRRGRRVSGPFHCR